jgi:tRNA(Ile)-lysidine synthase
MSTIETDRFATDLTAALGGPVARPILFAVSGGPDSLAMLSLGAAAFPGRVAAATIDHGLRAENADEAVMVAGQCARLGVPHVTLMPDAPIAGASIQARAREVRYALLAAHARSIGAACLVTAHHADDQAETFLMRAARGAGLSGLAGIRARVVIEDMLVVRPLLDWRRAELRAIARRAGMPFVDDPSNYDDRHDRTRFRRLLEANEWLDPPRLARAAAALAEADTDLRAVADWAWAQRATLEEGEVRFAVEGLPRALLRLLARRAIGVVRETAAITAPDWSEGVNVEPLLDAIQSGKRATQAGVVVSIRRGQWRFRPAPARRAPA